MRSRCWLAYVYLGQCPRFASLGHHGVSRLAHRAPVPAILSAPRGTTNTPKADMKSQGGDHFRAGRYAEAARCYSGAIDAETDPVELAKLLGNRSASYGLLSKHKEALADATRAVELDPNYIKGYFRQTTAHMALGQFSKAEKTASTGLRRQPDNKQRTPNRHSNSSSSRLAPGMPLTRTLPPRRLQCSSCSRTLRPREAQTMTARHPRRRRPPPAGTA
jgi:tetratricopeptide (TPR) repeat protein